MTKKVMPDNVPQIIFESSEVPYVARDCDACSPVIFTIPGSSIVPEDHPAFYFAVPGLVTQAIDTNYSSVISPFTQTFAVLNNRALSYLGSHTFQEIHPTVWQQALALGLLVPYSCPPPLTMRQESLTTLSAWLHLTDRCNLSCAYCYLPHSKIDMSCTLGQSAIDATIRSAIIHGYHSVKFKYAGGEPLLQFPLLLELHRYAQQVTTQQNLGLDGVVITNGTLLTPEILSQMKQSGLRLTISLDNLPSPTSSQKIIQRTYSNGRDSAADTVRGIELALECGSTPDISITVSGRNVAHLPGLLEWALARNLLFSLNFYRNHYCSINIPYVENEGGKDQQRNACTDTGLQLEKDTFIKGMLTAYRVIESKLPKWSLLGSLADMANLAVPHLRCCSVGHSYLVFDTNAHVSKCQMQMNRPVADAYADDPLAEVRSDRCGIQNVTVNEKKECQKCQWKYWCGGGCPLETYRMTGRYDLKSPNCNIYKALFPEVLRLEGLRLLKYAFQST